MSVARWATSSATRSLPTTTMTILMPTPWPNTGAGSATSQGRERSWTCLPSSSLKMWLATVQALASRVSATRMLIVSSRAGLLTAGTCVLGNVGFLPTCFSLNWFDNWSLLRFRRLLRVYKDYVRPAAPWVRTAPVCKTRPTQRRTRPALGPPRALSQSTNATIQCVRSGQARLPDILTSRPGRITLLNIHIACTSSNPCTQLHKLSMLLFAFPVYIKKDNQIFHACIVFWSSPSTFTGEDEHRGPDSRNLPGGHLLHLNDAGQSVHHIQRFAGHRLDSTSILTREFCPAIR